MRQSSKLFSFVVYRVLTVFVFTGLCSALSGQDIKTVKIDFKDKTIEGVEHVQRGDQVQFVIENINPNNWQFSIDSKDSVLYQSLKTPGFASLDASGLGALLSSAMGGGQKSLPNFPGIPIPATDFYTQNKLKLIRVDSAVMVLKQEIIQQQVKSLTIEEDLNGALASNLDVADFLGDFATQRLVVEEVQKETVVEVQRYATEMAAMKIDEIKNETVKKNKMAAVTAQQAKYAELASMADTLLKVLDPDWLFSQLSDFIYYHKGTTVKSFPMYLGKDLKTVELNFQPRSHLKFANAESISLELPRFPKYYYSVGLSFYGAALKQERYAGQYLSDSTIAVTEEPGIDSEIGVASLLRTGMRIDPEGTTGIHLTIGPGVSIADNPQLRLLVGGGLFIGGKHQGIGIDGGLIFGQVDVKSNTVTAGDVLPSDYGRLAVSKLDHAFFLSIGYMYKF